MVMQQFHESVRQWFYAHFDEPTPTQLDAWEAVSSHHPTLVAAPTGSGKTLAAFLSVIDSLVRRAVGGALEEQVKVVYVSPLKALSNDIARNLELPLAGIHTYFDGRCDGAHPVRITAAVRTGDTTPTERTRMRRTPPHILVTTPESLYILLTSVSGRTMLSSTETVIVDEIHALVPTKRGAHLALSLERLQGLCRQPLRRIGLSATQKPIETVAEFLTGQQSGKPCSIINRGHQRERDLQLSLPDTPLESVMSNDVWTELYDQITTLIHGHRTTLIFVNTRRLAERMAKALAERIDEDSVTAHHGSLSKEHRFAAEQKLKGGQLKALVATASLELGIDIGDIDLVCQMGSPRAISVFLQRVGRSGHQLNAIPKGRLFPLSRDDLVECTALLASATEGQLDQMTLYIQPLDVLAQQIVAEVSGGEEYELDALYCRLTRATPYADLARETYDRVIDMLAEGFSTHRGQRSRYLHLDVVNGRIRARKGARLTAITNGGTIPDQFDYDVILQPEGLKIGTLNEDFSFESLPGDIFQLGNTAYRILKVESGKVFVVDAKGQPPTIPFWFGEGLGRTDALSLAVSQLRERISGWLAEGTGRAIEQVVLHYRIPEAGARQLVHYLAAGQRALGGLPTVSTIIVERFFDQAGDQHLVIHSTFGSRFNRGWGLALRKRFCRKFNFELQAAALEDTIVLSLGSTHSFPLEEVIHYLKPATVREVLTQALLDAPMFPTHWRWNAAIALAIKRFTGGKKSPPQFQRTDAEDLLAVIFPDQIACAENIAGDREIPDHPLVSQTVHDCLHVLMDVARLQQVLNDISEGNIKVICRDLATPSSLAEEVLVARPYAFLDDAPAEERRTALVQTRQYYQSEETPGAAALHQDVIREVCKQAWPEVSNEDECHDALMILGVVQEQEAVRSGWECWFDALARDNRACRARLNAQTYWISAERLAIWLEIHPHCQLQPLIAPVASTATDAYEDAVKEVLRMRLQGVGPTNGSELASLLQLDPAVVTQGLIALEHEGYAMRGSFSDHGGEAQWCERGLLARIHRRTIKHLRKQTAPVSITGYMRFLFRWQGLDRTDSPASQTAEALETVLDQLEGTEVAAGAWEDSVLPARLNGYMNYWLDILCSSGRISWCRLSPAKVAQPHMKGATKQSPVTLSSRPGLRHWLRFSSEVSLIEPMRGHAKRLHEILTENGAQFFDDLVAEGGWLQSDVEQGLCELIGNGLVTSDNFAGLRALTGRSSDKRSARGRRVWQRSRMQGAGRWAVVDRHTGRNETAAEKRQSVEYIAKRLLKRYGILFRRLIDLEHSVPRWYELYYTLRRMEDRGEVRGGRFVDGFAGEQFALPEAVGLLRKMERQTAQGLIVISAADPLNLTGIVLPGERVPAVARNRILFRDGAVFATYVSGQVHWTAEVDESDCWLAQQRLISPFKTKPGRYRHVHYPSL